MCPVPNSLHRRPGWRGALAGGAPPGTGTAHGGTDPRDFSPGCVAAGRRFRGIHKPHGGVTVPVFLPGLRRVRAPTIRVLGAPSAGNAGGPPACPAATGTPPAPPGRGSRAGQAFPRTPVLGWSGGTELCPLTAAPGTPKAGHGDGAPWHGDPRGKGGHIGACPWRAVRDFLENGQEGIFNGRRDVKSGEKICIWQRASLETSGAEESPPSPTISFISPLSLAQGAWGIPPQISRYLTPQSSHDLGVARAGGYNSGVDSLGREGTALTAEWEILTLGKILGDLGWWEWDKNPFGARYNLGVQCCQAWSLHQGRGQAVRASVVCPHGGTRPGAVSPAMVAWQDPVPEP